MICDFKKGRELNLSIIIMLKFLLDRDAVCHSDTVYHTVSTQNVYIHVNSP